MLFVRALGTEGADSYSCRPGDNLGVAALGAVAQQHNQFFHHGHFNYSHPRQMLAVPGSSGRSISFGGVLSTSSFGFQSFIAVF